MKATERDPLAFEGATRRHRLAGLVAGWRMKWVTLAVWVALLAGLAPLAGRLGEVQNNEQTARLPDTAESTLVALAQQHFGGSETQLAIVVYERTSGITPEDRAKAQADASEFAKLPAAQPPLGPFASEDGKALRTLVPLVGKDNVTQAVEQARDLARRGPPGLTAHVTGQAGDTADQQAVFDTIDGVVLLAALGIVILLLLLIYRSPMLWIIPVLCSITALVLAQAAVYLLARYAGLAVNGQSTAILTVLVFGVATDYALLLVARYREELHRHADRHEAMAYAVRRAAPAIVASAATVAIGLLCLLFADMNATSGMGPVAAAGIVTALCAMTTLLPALLVVFGRWIFWPMVPRHDALHLEREATGRGLWPRVARLVAARPRAIWVTVSAGLLAMTFGLGSLNTGGLNYAGQYVNEVDSVAGAEVAARHFPAGAGAPAIVIAQASAAEQVQRGISGTPGVAEVSKPVIAAGLVRYEATLSDPSDSEAARQTVERLRETVHDIPGAEARVGGRSAIKLDTDAAADRDNKVIIPIVLAVIFVILVALLRAVVAPLLMIGTVLLSFLAALGAGALMFRHVFGFQGTEISFPLFAFIFLVALGVDYNIFLMHRVREESQALGTRRGIQRGLAVTGGVITSAGLVLAGTFAVLVTMPLVFIAEVGFVVAFGVLLDTVIVRSLLLPALAHAVGRRIWAPGRLGRAEAAGEASAGPEGVKDAPRVLNNVG
jgi:RND superfamily putative drug exporter